MKRKVEIDIGTEMTKTIIKDYSFMERNAKQFSDLENHSSLGQCFPILKWQYLCCTLYSKVNRKILLETRKDQPGAVDGVTLANGGLARPYPDLWGSNSLPTWPQKLKSSLSFAFYQSVA